jgi:hypothetical protein
LSYWCNNQIVSSMCSQSIWPIPISPKVSVSRFVLRESCGYLWLSKIAVGIRILSSTTRWWNGMRSFDHRTPAPRPYSKPAHHDIFYILHTRRSRKSLRKTCHDATAERLLFFPSVVTTIPTIILILRTQGFGNSFRG